MNDISTIDRLKKIRANAALTQIEFAESVNMKREAYASVEIGKANMTQTLLGELARVYNININWLLTGRGEMIVENINKFKSSINNEVTALAPIGVGDVNVIELSQPALASFFVNMEEDMRIARQAYMPGLPERDAPYYAMEVSGDSMYPHLRQGDWLYAERLECAPPPIKPQTLYAVAIGGNMLAKWLRIHPETDTIELISANPLYPSMHEPLSEVRAILRVVAVLKTV